MRIKGLKGITEEQFVAVEFRGEFATHLVTMLEYMLPERWAQIRGCWYSLYCRDGFPSYLMSYDGRDVPQDGDSRIGYPVCTLQVLGVYLRLRKYRIPAALEGFMSPPIL